VAERVPDHDAGIIDGARHTVPPPPAVSLSRSRRTSELAGPLQRLRGNPRCRWVCSVAPKLVDGVDGGAERVRLPIRCYAEPFEVVQRANCKDRVTRLAQRQRPCGKGEMGGDLYSTHVIPERPSADTMNFRAACESLGRIDEATSKEGRKCDKPFISAKLKPSAHSTKGRGK
jgi:hypothetical protein